MGKQDGRESNNKTTGIGLRPRIGGKLRTPRTQWLKPSNKKDYVQQGMKQGRQERKPFSFFSSFLALLPAPPLRWYPAS